MQKLCKNLAKTQFLDKGNANLTISEEWIRKWNWCFIQFLLCCFLWDLEWMQGKLAPVIKKLFGFGKQLKIVKYLFLEVSKIHSASMIWWIYLLKLYFNKISFFVEKVDENQNKPFVNCDKTFKKNVSKKIKGISNMFYPNISYIRMYH